MSSATYLRASLVVISSTERDQPVLIARTVVPGYGMGAPYQPMGPPYQPMVDYSAQQYEAVNDDLDRYYSIH